MSRVVIISPGGSFTEDLAALLASRGVSAHAVLLYPPSPGAGGTRARRAARALLAPVVHLRRRVMLAARARRVRGCGPVRLTGGLNSRRFKRDLRRLAPDVAVLARCMLLDEEVLSIPRLGVANVHPGLLPWIRGNSPLGNSLLRQVPLGCTAFWVDRGIDTGAIIERRLLPVAGGEDLNQLRAGLTRLWLEMTADLVATALRGALPDGSRQDSRFPLCRTLAEGDRTAVDAAVRSDAARALFERWDAYCEPDHRLPSSWTDAEPVLQSTARSAAAPGR